MGEASFLMAALVVGGDTERVPTSPGGEVTAELGLYFLCGHVLCGIHLLDVCDPQRLMVYADSPAK